MSDDDFARRVDLAPLRSLTVQHRQTLKTLDSLARQTVSQIAGRTRFDGRDPLFNLLDMMFRPDAWRTRNIIKIKNVPVRQDLAASLTHLPNEERARILREGTISLDLWEQPATQQAVQKIASTAAFKLDALRQVESSAMTLKELGRGDLQALALVPPTAQRPDDQKWKPLVALYGLVPEMVEHGRQLGVTITAPEPGYDASAVARAVHSAFDLQRAWRQRDPRQSNQLISSLADVLPALSTARYPSATKRTAEVIYNRLTKLTMPGAALYFLAFLAFLLSSRSEVRWLHKAGVLLMVVGLLVHTAGIAVRWWLIEKNTNDWFHSIPIKNQFESVLFSAWFGAVVGLVLELWKRKSLFGAAASFVGWLSLVAIFVSPFVFGRDIGGEIGQVNGVLMSYWLYIHVTTVVASYALIGMSFCLGVWWLVRYWRDYGTLARVANKRQLSADGLRGLDVLLPKPALAGVSARSEALTPVMSSRGGSVPDDRTATDAKGFLATLDQCNLTILQLAFWILGVGIILGAVWADQSWGRPWGWDPKETFALVTWIVYLIVVHVRIVTPNKAWWTAVLSVVGFFVMLFNWIGVNFFLVGLHSYA